MPHTVTLRAMGAVSVVSGATSSLFSARLARRAATLLVACTVATAALPAQAANRAAPDAAEVERLYIEGQDRNEQGDYQGAADSWTRLLSQLPESAANKAVRENLIINILEARINAYKRLVGDDGVKDITHLEKGKETLDAYYTDFSGVHGDRVAINAQVQEKADELERLLEEARKEQEARAAAAQTDTETQADEPKPKVVVDPSNVSQLPPADDDAGKGLIIGGGVALGVALGGIVMIGVGAAVGEAADKDYREANERVDMYGEGTAELVEAINDRDEAEFRGKQGNAVLISGIVLAVVGGAAGGTMLAFGLKRRKEARSGGMARIDSISPWLSGNGAGIGLRGRF